MTTELQPIGDIVRPTRPRVKPSSKANLPFIGMEHVEAHTMKLLGTVPATSMKSAAVHFQPGDVLYGRLRPYLNKVLRPNFEGLCSAEFIVLPANERLDGSYLQYFLNSSSFTKFATHLNAGDRPRVDFDQIAPYRIPLPDAAEQRSIVAEIEKQFSRLDEAVANLQRTKANLRRYKASVLTSAVLGRIVETEASIASREARGYEDGAHLLQRVLQNRRERWAAKRRYREPQPADCKLLPELPPGWAWASPEQLSASEPHSLAIGPFGSSLKVADYRQEGVPLVFVRNIRSGFFGGPDAVFVSREKAEKLHAHVVESGDILVTKMGDPPGDACTYPPNLPAAVITADCIKFRVDREMLNPHFVEYAIQSGLVKQQISSITKGVAQLKINLANFSRLGLPLPPVSEQHRIVSEVDRRLSIVREVEAEVDANLKRAQSLRQAILAKAFSGAPA